KIGTKYYHISSLKVNWFEASLKCRTIGGNLASFQSMEELEAIQIWLTPRIDYWIDFTKLANERDFISSVTGRKPLFIKWMDDEPKTLRKNEDCGLLFHRTFRHLMNYESCFNKWAYICEFP
ncbi:hypothetical protein KR222_007096, partial [Zaprionus bogoriensis]